ncbi:TetR/AcrR family transcriptional regulator [bacterium]|jgi:AcrR family transcriptional regulator|nr:TetR/AcrR family transcriptional regulator [bacterium]
MVFCKRNRQATERSLLRAASELFSRKGFENTRTLEIAKVAGVNEALIARYFGGKEGLLLAVMKDEEGTHSLVESESVRSDDTVFPDSSSGLTLSHALQEYFRAGEKAIAEKEAFVRIALSRALLDPEISKVIREKFIERVVRKISRSIRTHASAREIDAEDIEALSMLIAASNHSFNFVYRRVYSIPPAKIERALSILARSVEAYLLSLPLKRTRSVTTNS